MSFTVIATVGPNLLNRGDLLKGIDAAGPCVYRLNGAHLTREGAVRNIRTLRKLLPSPKIMVDLPGNKVRTGVLDEPIRLVKGEAFHIYNTQVNFPDFHKYLRKGDMIYANDSIYTLEVLGTDSEKIELLSHSDGELKSNKGMHVRGVNKHLPFLFQRDRELIEAAIQEGVAYISLSYVRNAADVREALSILEAAGAGIEVSAKIETASAVERLDEIFDVIKMANVDRGDLSTDIGMLALARAQEKIIDAAKKKGVRLFLATQFLKNMEENPVPLIAEMIDLHNSIRKGIAGIQLSEETAVGKYPAECVKLVFDTLVEAMSGE